MPVSVEWEVLVVDNNSTDRTREAVESLSLRFGGRFRYLFESKQGKSHALNTGIAEAKGEVLVFVDDDVTVDVDWLRNLTQPLLEGEWAGAGGRVRPKLAGPTPNWLPSTDYILGPFGLFDQGDKPCALTKPPIGNNMAFHKGVFRKHGAFRTDLGPCPGSEIRNEDTELGRRFMTSGEQLCYVASAVVYHLVPEKRIRKEYFLKWWFDKARADVRETGFPDDGKWMVWRIPLLSVRRVLRWSLQWMVSADPRSRFERKVNVWINVGVILETYRLSARTQESYDKKADPSSLPQGVGNVREDQARNVSYKV